MKDTRELTHDIEITADEYAQAWDNKYPPCNPINSYVEFVASPDNPICEDNPRDSFSFTWLYFIRAKRYWKRRIHIFRYLAGKG